MLDNKVTNEEFEVNPFAFVSSSIELKNAKGFASNSSFVAQLQ